MSIKNNNHQNILHKLRSKSVIIWDNDGTIMGTLDPDDRSHERIILPNVKEVMNKVHALHIVCSGSKTTKSELQNFDPMKVIDRFTKLMKELPIKAAVFAPTIGGTECWVMIHTNDGLLEVRKAHEDPRYKHLIGKFKKPDSGMFRVIADLVKEFDVNANSQDMIMIGDMWQDEKAAEGAGIEFLDVAKIHCLDTNC
jgi:hypothetical protein